MRSASSAPASPPYPADKSLSCRRAIRHSGVHLAGLADRLRHLETIMIAVAELQDEGGARVKRRSRMQALDLVIQELAALSDILIGAADQLSDTPNPVIDALIDLPRLQSLSLALREGQANDTPSEIVLF